MRAMRAETFNGYKEEVGLTRAGFRAGKTVLVPAIGGSIGNAVTQLARALGAKRAISSTTNHAKAGQAKAKSFRLADAAEALRYLIEGRPFGRVILTI